MNSPAYLGVVIKPDNLDDRQVEAAGYSDNPAVANGQAMREWQKAEAEWQGKLPSTRVESPMHDLYVCVRRLHEPEVAAYLLENYGLDVRRA